MTFYFESRRCRFSTLFAIPQVERSRGIQVSRKMLMRQGKLYPMISFGKLSQSLIGCYCTTLPSNASLSSEIYDERKVGEWMLKIVHTQLPNSLACVYTAASLPIPVSW